MADTIVVIAAGEMGAGIGKRLTERGARVLTSLKGRGSGQRGARQASRHDRRRRRCGAGRAGRFHPVGGAAGPGAGAGGAAEGPLAKASAQSDLYRLQCRSRPTARSASATTLAGSADPLCRRRHHRRAARREHYSPALYVSGQPPPRRRGSRITGCGSARWMADRHGLGAEDVLRRADQRLHRHRHRDHARRHARRLRRGAGAGTVRKPAAGSGLAHAARCRACFRRPIAGSPRWRKSPSSSATTRRRTTCIAPSPGSTSAWPAARTARRPAAKAGTRGAGANSAPCRFRQKPNRPDCRPVDNSRIIAHPAAQKH